MDFLVVVSIIMTSMGVSRAQHLPYPPYHPRAPSPIEMADWSPREAGGAATFVEEGRPLELWCEVDKWWGACRITHVPSGNLCSFKVNCR